MTDITQTLTERGSRYGKFETHARISQDLKAVVRQHSHNKTLTDDQREALDMIMHKVARILNGDPNYSDSWIDIAGYSQLIADRLDGVSR